MTAATPDDLEGRTQLRLRLRPNLALTRHEEGGRPYYVLKDPVGLAYFRLDEGQHFLIGLMDGGHSLAQIRAAYEAEYRPARLSVDELEGFARQLVEAGLVQNDSPRAGALLHERASRQRRQAWWARLANPFCVRIPLADPDRLLLCLLPVGRVLFSRLGATLTGLTLLAALLLIATRWHEFCRRLPAADDLFSARTLVAFWVALGLVKVLHELGHGLCCKVLGGVVHEFGVLVLFGFPTLYCNVSDSWALRGRWRRAAVGAAGMYVELVVAALATFVWWRADPGGAVGRLSFALMAVCSVTTVLGNANPLLRLDGYFILADVLGVPNLADVANCCLRSGALRFLGVPAEAAELPCPVRPAPLALYAVASHVYRCVLLGGILYAICNYLTDHRLGALGEFVVLAGAGSLLAWPATRLLWSLKQSGQLRRIPLGRARLGAVAVAAVVLSVFGVPLPVHVRGLALLQPEPSRVRRVPVPDAGGFLKEIHVRDGQVVQAGDVLAVLENPRLEIKLRLAETEAALRLRRQAAQVARLAEPGADDGDGPEAWQRTGADAEALARQLTTLREQAARLVLRAPVAGTVANLRPPEDRGKWLERGAEVCSVGDARALRAVVLLEPADHELVSRGAAAALRVHGGGSAVSRGVVASVAPVEARQIPPQLSHHAGGDVVTAQDPLSHAETPQRQHFLVAVALDEIAVGAHPGVLGRVRIDAGRHTLWWRLRRALGTSFNWGL